jgi:pyruvate-formate lyase
MRFPRSPAAFSGRGASPEKYRDLIVRIGGYSDYFNHLSLDVRKEMARRFGNRQ